MRKLTRDEFNELYVTYITRKGYTFISEENMYQLYLIGHYEWHPNVFSSLLPKIQHAERIASLQEATDL